MQHAHSAVVKNGGSDCCAPKAKPDTHGHAHGDSSHSLFSTSFHATLHCLTGCVIGEVAGLAIGVHYGLGMWPTMILATVLAYIAGFSLAIPPIMRKQNLSFSGAFKAIWLGEAISIGVMEVVMNWTDYMVGGVQAASLASPIFYIGIAVAIPAGFLAGWPVNYLLLKKQIKGKCH
jgi:hypothetical protein